MRNVMSLVVALVVEPAMTGGGSEVVVVGCEMGMGMGDAEGAGRTLVVGASVFGGSADEEEEEEEEEEDTGLTIRAEGRLATRLGLTPGFVVEGSRVVVLTSSSDTCTGVAVGAGVAYEDVVPRPVCMA
jgi:hypothetical protein